MSKQNIVFVIPWYGKDAIGGAELQCKTLVEHLHTSGFDVKVFTTCSKQFQSEWKNDYKPGIYSENGVEIHRFKINPRDVNIFNSLNEKIILSQKITKQEELEFFKNNINSKDMLKEISKDKSSIFVFIPYLYGTTFFGSQIHPDRSVVIPCLHDEGYAKMSLVKDMLTKIKGICFNSFPEQQFASSIIRTIPNHTVTGEGIDLPTKIPEPKMFKEKYNLQQFILCASRKETGKNIPLLINYFSKYLENNNTDLKLVLTGKGEIEIPQKFSKNIISLYLSQEELHAAYSSAICFCLPSLNESFSRVIMESWLHSTPVLVHEKCSVTKFHCLESNGGLFFDSFNEFESCIKFYLTNSEIRNKLGKNGKNYVLQNFTWEKVIHNYKLFFNSIS